jgi:beta-N-acetylhexosaminidase
MARRTSIPELQRNIGQLFVIGFDGTDMSQPLRALIRRVQPAGVILFARNITTPQQTHQLLAACRSLLTVPPFLCVDMEGGLVDRLKNAFAPAPSPAAVFATQNAKLFREHGRIIGQECRATGFNVDFAPVSDLAFPASHSVMGSRAVSEDPRETIGYVREFLRGLRAAGVLGCGKHFPGLGEGNLDSHHALPVIKKPWAKQWSQDLLPYRMLRGVYSFVMVCHAAYPTLTRNLTPASLSSKWISDVLRKQIGYRGLVISDDLEMGGVLTAVSTDQAAVEHIRAGGDLALICHQEEHVQAAYEAMIRTAENDPRFARQARESSRRIIAFKKKHARLLRNIPKPDAAKVSRVTRQLWEFAEQVRLESLSRGEGA